MNVCVMVCRCFSRSAVNFNAGCKTAASNVVMAIAMMLTLLFLTPLFYYTPNAVLSAIIASAMLGLIDIHAAIHLWKVDKIDFFVFLGGSLGVVFASVEIGLITAVRLHIYSYAQKVLNEFGLLKTITSSYKIAVLNYWNCSFLQISNQSNVII